MTKKAAAFPVSREARTLLGLPEDRFDAEGLLVLRSPRDARDLVERYAGLNPSSRPSAADIFGAALIATAWRLLLERWAEEGPGFETEALEAILSSLGEDGADRFLAGAAAAYPSDAVRHGGKTPAEAVGRETPAGRRAVLRSKILAFLSAGNPAFAPFHALFDHSVVPGELETKAWEAVKTADPGLPTRAPEDDTPLSTLLRPVVAAPDSVKDQLLYVLTRWGNLLGDWTGGIVSALDMIEEETRPRGFGGPGPAKGPGIGDLDGSARFSDDVDWMPTVVLLAKNVLVWLDQLSKSYGRPVTTLAEIPDEELDQMASRGFNALWLIGLWERSPASRDIKRRMGNPEAAASAYSLFGYDIAGDIGGWEALENLRERAAARGIRLSSDMVPNHVGIDSDWVRHHPERLLTAEECPYPGYKFDSEDLSGDPEVDIRLEDHYYDKSDAAVVFRRIDRNSGKALYVYHGNDGTSMPWNDTAQIDFLNPEAREAVIRDILHVAGNFPIIRFDAAMVLARKHVRRLWYPAPGEGGAVPSRSEAALTDDEFNEAMPAEFWREVVDRVAEEVPGTLLLAEAFWMMEGFFVRNLGMHRVYNSAFMNMLRDGKNDEYRRIIKETLAFDPGVLQRFVNFMNNPDEETAVGQFGGGDRYFAVCTLLATLPGLPMLGHGQIEGLSEKYGMEYTRAYRDETPDTALVARHEKEIFPLLARRSLFAGAASFRLYDLIRDDGSVAEDLYAYTNADGADKALVVVNNSPNRIVGRLKRSAPSNIGEDRILNETLASALDIEKATGRDWILLKNRIDGLWFLRSSEELIEEGLGIDIDGFGRQVFLDFRYEKETPDGAWGRLAVELSGAGTPDPDGMIAEMRLGPIRDSLRDLIGSGGLGAMADAVRRGATPEWPADPKTAAAGISRLLGHHLELAASKKGGDAASSQVREEAGTEVVSTISRRLAGSARLWRLFGGGVRRRLNRAFPPSAGDGAEFLAAWSILASILETAEPSRPQEAWRLWGLGAWLAEAGVGDPAATASCFEAVLAAGDWNQAGRGGGAPTLPRLMSLKEVRNSCGVNSWDGVVWYDRDGWIRTVRALVLSRAARSGARPGLRRLIGTWRRAGDAAEYRLEKLLEAAR